MTCKNHIGSRFTVPRVRVHISADESRRLIFYQAATILLFAYVFIARREIHNEHRACAGMSYRRRIRRPQILAYLYRKAKAVHFLTLEDELSAKGACPARELYLSRLCRSSCKVPLLIKFVVVRQKGLWHNSQSLPLLSYYRAVVQLALIFHRCAENRNHIAACRGGYYFLRRQLRSIQHSALQKQILTRVRRHAKLAERKYLRALRARFTHTGDYLFSIILTIRNLNIRRSCGYL